MATIHPGRFSTKIEGPFVVFLIGMRINRLWAVHKWMPVTRAMGPMISELVADPSLGLLTAFSSVYWRGVMVTQYWRSFDHLVNYASNRNAAHLPGCAVADEGRLETQIPFGNDKKIYEKMTVLFA